MKDKNIKEKNNYDKSLTKLIMAGVGLSGTIITGATVTNSNSKNFIPTTKQAENKLNLISIDDIKKETNKVEETTENNFFNEINDFLEFKEKITEELGYFVSENFTTDFSQEEMTLDKLLGRDKESKEIVEEKVEEVKEEYIDSFTLENNENKTEKVYELERYYGFKDINPEGRW